MNLLLLSYNNYYNRRVKGYDSLYPYAQNSTAYQVVGNINFDPNDGINTSLIIGTGVETWTASLDKASWDYLIAFEGDPEAAPTQGTIVSRWFILNVNRTRGKQYKLTLQRDLLYDYYTPVVSSPAFVEKGWLREANPLIFNSEDIQVNQIKKEETLLKDETGCPWLVMYAAKNAITADKVITVPQDNIDNSIDISASTIDNFVL